MAAVARRASATLASHALAAWLTAPRAWSVSRLRRPSDFPADLAQAMASSPLRFARAWASSRWRSRRCWTAAGPITGVRCQAAAPAAMRTAAPTRPSSSFVAQGGRLTTA